MIRNGFGSVQVRSKWRCGLNYVSVNGVLVRTVQPGDRYDNWDFLEGDERCMILVPCSLDRRRGPREEHDRPVLILAHDTGIVEVHLREPELKAIGLLPEAFGMAVAFLDADAARLPEAPPAEQARAVAQMILQAVEERIRPI